jgi:hypothetical protein
MISMINLRHLVQHSKMLNDTVGSTVNLRALDMGDCNFGNDNSLNGIIANCTGIKTLIVLTAAHVTRLLCGVEKAHSTRQ